MHLGRTPSRLPPVLHAPELGPAEAWRRTVDTALGHGVQAVLLAGDVVDRDDDFFEAYRALEDGVRKLADAGIDVIGVAGNHDVRVLPRLARHIPQFRLLGEGGTWESCRIGGDGDGNGDGGGDAGGDAGGNGDGNGDGGGEAVTLWGWSFPQARVFDSPLAGESLDPAQGINLGLLHCDRDAGPNSPYAPVTRLELDGAGLDGWLLGHIHKPDALTAASPNGYLGSLTGMDRGESGPRGPWMITVADGRIDEVEHLPLAPLRWETLEVDLEGIDEPFQAEERLLAAVTDLDGRMSSLPSAPNAVGLSVVLAGRTGFGGAALDRMSREDRDEPLAGAAGTRYFIESTRLDTRPEIDLDELARRQDPVGLLAARMLWLDRPEGDPERDRLVEKARQDLRDQAAKSVWHGLKAGSDVPEPEPEPVTWLRQAGFRALDRLLGQTSARRDAG